MSHTKWQWVGHLLCIWKTGKEVAFTILINLNNGRVYISWSFIRQILSCGPNDRVIMESVYISRSAIMHIFSCAPYDRVIMESCVYIAVRYNAYFFLCTLRPRYNGVGVYIAVRYNAYFFLCTLRPRYNGVVCTYNSKKKHQYFFFTIKKTCLI